MYLYDKNPNENREVLVYEVSLNRYLETLFLSCNFKDEKMSDYKICTKQ